MKCNLPTNLENSSFDSVKEFGGFATARYNCSEGYVGETDYHAYYKCENFHRNPDTYIFQDCKGKLSNYIFQRMNEKLVILFSKNKLYFSRILFMQIVPAGLDCMLLLYL